MIKRADEQRVQKTDGLRGGVGITTAINFFEGEECYNEGRLFAINTLPKGASIGYHKHENEFEIYYILSGEGLVNDNGEESVLKKGDAHMCKSGDFHGMVNNGEEDLVFVALVISC